MAEHFTREKFDEQVRTSIERSQQKRRVGTGQLGNPDTLRAAIERRRQRREIELPA